MRYVLALVVASILVSAGCNDKPKQVTPDPNLPATSSKDTPTGDPYAATPTPVPYRPTLKAPTPAPEIPVPTPGPKASGNTYTIKAHDTFYSIAREQFGDVKKAKEIMALNPDLDPAKLPIGKTINLPAK